MTLPGTPRGASFGLRRSVQGILFAAALAFGGSAQFVQAETLDEKLSVPSSGKIELLSCVTAHVTGLNIQNLDDVLKLREELLEIGMTDAAFQSWEYLEQLGAKKLPRVLPPPPPGVNGVRVFPDWHAVSVAFDGERFSQIDTYAGGQLTQTMVSTPASDAIFSKSIGAADSAEHYGPGLSRRLRLDSYWLMSRSKTLFAFDYQVAQRGENQLYSAVVNKERKGETHLFANSDQDAIYAAAITSPTRVVQFALYWGETAGDRRAPRYVLRFQARPGEGEWSVHARLIQSAELDGKIDPDRFKLGLPSGTTYVSYDEFGDSKALRVKTEIDDFAGRTPFETVEMIKALEEALRAAPPKE